MIAWKNEDGAYGRALGLTVSGNLLLNMRPARDIVQYYPYPKRPNDGLEAGHDIVPTILRRRRPKDLSNEERCPAVQSTFLGQRDIDTKGA